MHDFEQAISQRQRETMGALDERSGLQGVERRPESHFPLVEQPLRTESLKLSKASVCIRSEHLRADDRPRKVETSIRSLRPHGRLVITHFAALLYEDDKLNNSKTTGSRAPVLNQRGTRKAEPVALALALARSEQVQAKVEACADDLASVNDIVKTKMAEGATTVAANSTLASTEKVESKVRESVGDLQEVNKCLARGLDDLKQTETTLAESRDALAETAATLVTTQLRAMHDAATNLPNRDLFNDRVTHAISMAQRHGWTLAVMFLDLDRFKTINDTYGHSVGDGVLKEVAKRLLEHSREEDTVCRNGGDEFLYLLVDPQGPENIKRIANHVLKNISQPMVIDDQEFIIRASIGIAVYPDNGATQEQLTRNADTAMYRAKKQGCGSACFCTAESA